MGVLLSGEGKKENCNYNGKIGLKNASFWIVNSKNFRKGGGVAVWGKEKGVKLYKNRGKRP